MAIADDYPAIAARLQDLAGSGAPDRGCNPVTIRITQAGDCRPDCHHHVTINVTDAPVQPKEKFPE